jgi:hypothetical protein
MSFQSKVKLFRAGATEEKEKQNYGEQGLELMLRMNGMTRADVQIVEFPYADD